VCRRRLQLIEQCTAKTTKFDKVVKDFEYAVLLLANNEKVCPNVKQLSPEARVTR
jgi:hypothetical protein